MTQRSFVSVVDDDESVRESLPDLLRALGHDARTFKSAEDFLVSGQIDNTKCLILDFSMPGMNGLDLQQELKKRQKGIPIIFITAHKDNEICAKALDQGASACLYKPFSDTELIEALSTALA
jgi:FixJ family two-component response regulator